ncbi:U11/U12 small nuclear ribonucleoprotein 25 kDa protein-like [Impatiens glandulifera]|uniref:U11/U12 small nuclear ribonucleoprotein 25 kDa protein-like n=1 Tax=Impatiens glandulifera TaxID=253017 RepID=UPI001FB0E037|nr:U11/U12 small nuclear ribonucleoprotein 25 kDa protein-like [Impatiens glandulifera]
MAKVIISSVDDGVPAFEVSSPLLSLESNIRTFSDSKLPPPQFINLSVLKLDGSSFDVNVPGNSKVGDIKFAIEELFNSSSLDSTEEFSWSQVWGYFCLCYNGEKLINDKADIQTLGMKDKDQLQFVKHLAMDYTPNSTPARHQMQNPTRSSSNFLACLSRPQTFEVEGGCGDNEISIPKFRVGHMFSNRNTYLRLFALRRKK